MSECFVLLYCFVIVGINPITVPFQIERVSQENPDSTVEALCENSSKKV